MPPGKHNHRGKQPNTKTKEHSNANPKQIMTLFLGRRLLAWVLFSSSLAKSNVLACGCSPLWGWRKVWLSLLVVVHCLFSLWLVVVLFAVYGQIYWLI